jgi:Domain of Unknown Function (DUF1080)
VQARKRRGTVVSTAALLIGLLAALLPSSASAAGTSILLNQNFQSLPTGQTWSDGSVHGDLKSQFNGYGSVGVVKSGGKVLSLQPKKATSPSVTHAALVTSTEKYKDIELSVRQKTVKQLRDGSAPNTWETAWTVWHYTDNTHFYYLILKPNGWELGKADPKYPGAQRFLATGSNVKFPVGSWNEVVVRQQGNAVDVTVDGQHLTHFVDKERPYLGGSVGMYTEDARVYFDDLSVEKV